jgi:hypothetical protein
MIQASHDVDFDALDASEWLRLARRGDFEGAWRVSDRIRERRAGHRDWTIPRHLQHVWDGGDLTGRRVLIRCYHGLGDTIQFIRYASLVRAVAKSVIVWAQPSLLPLLRCVSGIDRLLPLHEGAPDVEYDVDIEVMELAYAFRSTLATIPHEVPYLATVPLALNGRRPKVGIVWRAGDWDARRSIEFEQIASLLELTHISWYGLQIDMGEDTRHTNLHALDVRGLVRTARAIRAMDLVISIDSMPAHLAGALGVPVWTLLPYDADWRWLEARSDSPWYPTMRLFRQKTPGDWSSVIDDVRSALDRFEPQPKHFRR